jgi:hypothetical protein
MCTGEIKLWRAVINMAISDALNKRLNAWDRRAALHWLWRDNVDFFVVCDLAGVEPEAIRRGFLQGMKRNN